MRAKGQGWCWVLQPRGANVLQREDMSERKNRGKKEGGVYHKKLIL